MYLDLRVSLTVTHNAENVIHQVEDINHKICMMSKTIGDLVTNGISASPKPHV